MKKNAKLYIKAAAIGAAAGFIVLFAGCPNARLKLLSALSSLRAAIGRFFSSLAAKIAGLFGFSLKGGALALPSWRRILLAYLLVNLLVFLLYRLDKRRAEKKGRRIPENLLLIAAVPGIFGAVFGMYFLHHKTKKRKFSVGVPLILAAELLLLILFLIFLI